MAIGGFVGTQVPQRKAPRPSSSHMFDASAEY